MMNTSIVNLEQEIINLINNANVPIAATCLILDKITREANKALTNTLKEEEQAKIAQDENNMVLE